MLALNAYWREDGSQQSFRLAPNTLRLKPGALTLAPCASHLKPGASNLAPIIEDSHRV